RLGVHMHNPRDAAADVHRTVDDRPFGGGPGMVMQAEPLAATLEPLKAAGSHVVYLSPQGRVFDQAMAGRFAERDAVVLVCGRYEGIDERVIDAWVDEEVSVGDYVLSGGEPAAMVVIDAVARLLEGTLGHSASAEQDSFTDGLLDWPHYTRPTTWRGREVPAVLRSGDHAAIAAWRRQQALGRTAERRPDLLERVTLDDEDKALLRAYRAAVKT
ncbi:MAG: tRNA (guanosine(37)-N1)-methyltransferase TrmD, partial [Pseudomonadota bacterium]